MKQFTAIKQILKQDDREVFTKGYMRNGKQYVGCPYMYCAFNEKRIYRSTMKTTFILILTALPRV